MKLDILAIGAHPDDIEISCCGTILHHISLGHKVVLLDLTSGELGTRGDAETRLREAGTAAKMIGAEIRENLMMADGFFEQSKENMLELIKKIRQYKPEIVLANSLSDRHPDHGRAAKLIADACFYSGLVKVETESEGKLQEAWRPKTVYHYIQDYNLEPDFVFDISNYIERKFEILMAYKSQFYNPNSNEPETPISSREFIEFLKSKSCTYGRAAGFHYAEAFNVGRYIGVNNLFDLH
ncbi:MAG: bacillithiol biosynthesis deacetylase BshB1 [Bacteroidota bacterium]